MTDEAEVLTQNFIRVNMWNNATQSYNGVGSLVFEQRRLGSTNAWTVGFIYDDHYRGPAIDPANLKPQVNDGYHLCKSSTGGLPAYFTQFLPGDFSSAMISQLDPVWKELAEVERLWATTLAIGDFGAPQLNAQLDQRNAPIRDMKTLSHLVTTIRTLQSGGSVSPSFSELRAPLCLHPGGKPKIDVLFADGDATQRYVVKLNSTGKFNDARISAALAEAATLGGISAAGAFAKTLECGEDVLFSLNYARSDQRVNGGAPTHRIIKHNRVSMSVLLSDETFFDEMGLPPIRGRGATIAHVVEAIKAYSDDPVSDLHELFRRSVFDVATTHVNNGLQNIEMFDSGGGKWRLSPLFHVLPSPDDDAAFDVSLADAAIASLVSLDGDFVRELSARIGINEKAGLKMAHQVLDAVSQMPTLFDKHGVSARDRDVVEKAVRIKESAAAATYLADQPGVMLPTGLSDSPGGDMRIQSRPDLGL
ncbi:hypothetical protein A3709_20580 [Halioglobus sp. HI00S01]|uniref:HipA domain-containing protein n=1 Tax=Halioglobus sp. HI00S01 TaxID=1822214 RepID=UPI0007C3B8C8|nr:HipA domain-containing protein [Halioglobus sp. HI00S01]KZX58010.1 hypothetical protein A3709_20580 [Halioglobus sp. HI00S01]